LKKSVRIIFQLVQHAFPFPRAFHGCVFLGIQVPIQRKIASEFRDLSLDEIQVLLNSQIHEKRLIALLILMDKYKKSNEKQKIFEFYLENAKRGRINNWDLVDLSSCKIVGEFLLDKNREILYKLTKGNLWETAETSSLSIKTATKSISIRTGTATN